MWPVEGIIMEYKMSAKFEMRWYVRPGWDGPETILQYRYQFKQTDYSAVNPQTKDYIKQRVWLEWTDVPVVNSNGQ